MRQLEFLLRTSMILIALFFFGCRSNNDIVSIEYKKGDYWIENFRNDNFPSKSFSKDKIYCSSLEIGSGKQNYFYCLDLKTGKVDWASPVDDWACKPAIVSDSFIYYCSYVGDIYKFDSKGAQLWKSKLQSPYGGHSLNVSNNNLLVTTVTNGIFEYDIQSGKIVSHIGANTLGVPLPVFDEQAGLFAGLIFGAAEGPRGTGAVCKRLHDNQELWRKDIGEIAGNKMFTSSGRLYFFDSSWALNCLGISTGKLIWRIDRFGKKTVNAQVINPHMVFNKGEIIYYDTDLDKMVELDSESGKILSVASYQQLLAEKKLKVEKSRYEILGADNHTRYFVSVTDSLETSDDYAKTFNIIITKEIDTK